MDDANKAIERRPKDKIYQKHKEYLEQTIKNQIMKEVDFINKLVEKAQAQLELRKRINHMKRLKRQAQKAQEEAKKTQEEGEEEKHDCLDHDSDDDCGHRHGKKKEEDEELDLKYPEECRVLDIMRDKYHEAIRFFTDTNDKKQQQLAVKEFQRFAYFYHEKMGRYITFDPQDIEDDVYSRLSEDVKHALADPKVLRQILIICNRKAQQILEDDEVNVLNFQMFQYAMKIFQKEKKAQMKKEDEENKRREAAENPPAKTQKSSVARLILVNLIFFAVVAGGLMMVSGHSLFDFLGVSFWAAKSDDDTDGSHY